jgi:hypothetical protein
VKEVLSEYELELVEALVMQGRALRLTAALNRSALASLLLTTYDEDEQLERLLMHEGRSTRRALAALGVAVHDPLAPGGED